MWYVELTNCEVSEPRIIAILLCILRDLFGVRLDRNSIIVNSMKLLRNFAIKSKQMWKWKCECNLVRRIRYSHSHSHSHRHLTYFNIFFFIVIHWFDGIIWNRSRHERESGFIHGVSCSMFSKLMVHVCFTAILSKYLFVCFC